MTEQTIERLGTSIAVLGLSSRAYKCLVRGNTETVEQFLKTDKETIMRIRNIGEVNFAEIVERVREFGFEY